MEKHFNSKHEVIIRSQFEQFFDKDKNYKNGDKITLKECVKNTHHYISSHEGIAMVSLSRDFIIDIYNQIMEIEENTKEGEYCDLPF